MTAFFVLFSIAIGEKSSGNNNEKKYDETQKVCQKFCFVDTQIDIFICVFVKNSKLHGFSHICITMNTSPDVI